MPERKHTTRPSRDRRPRPESQHDEPRQRGRRDRPGDGALWLYGVHPVCAALLNPRRRWRRLLAAADALADLPEAVRAAAGARVTPASRADIAALLPAGAPHQGLALEALPLEPPMLAEIAAAAPGDALVVVLDQVSDPHNVGAILRSAAAFGVRAVVTPDRHAPGETGTLARAASGAVDVVPLVRVANLARALDELADFDFWRIGLDAGGPGVLRGARHRGPRAGRIAVVLGAEGRGLRRLTAERCDELARLALPPHTQAQMPSLNVSNAAAIALYELTAGGGTPENMVKK